MTIRPRSTPHPERSPHQSAAHPKHDVSAAKDPKATKPRTKAEEEAEEAAARKKPSQKGSQASQSPTSASTGIGRQIHSTVSTATAAAKQAGTAAHHNVDIADLASPTSDVQATGGLALQAGKTVLGAGFHSLGDAYHMATSHRPLAHAKLGLTALKDAAGAKIAENPIGDFAKHEGSAPLGFHSPKGAPTPGKNTSGLAATAEAAAEAAHDAPALTPNIASGHER